MSGVRPKPRLVGSAVRYGGTTWSRADGPTADMNWTLRYGTPEQREAIALAVASVLSSYTALVYLPAKRRAEIVRMLREAEDMAGTFEDKEGRT